MVCLIYTVQFTTTCWRLGHYLLYISFSSGNFSKVHAGGRPLPLYHYPSAIIIIIIIIIVFDRHTKIGVQELIILYLRVNITRESRPCSSSNWSPSNRPTL